MIVPKITDGLYVVPFIARHKWGSAARELRRTADPELYAKRLAPSNRRTYIMQKFHDVLVHGAEDLSFKGNAKGLKKAMQEGNTDYENAKLSVALSGGGSKVIAFMSFLETLREYGVPFANYAGTSAGSIAALFDRSGMDFKSVWNVLDEDLFKALIYSPKFRFWEALFHGERIRNFFGASLPEQFRTFGDLPGLYVTSVLENSIRAGQENAESPSSGRFVGHERVVFSSEFDPGMLLEQGVYASMDLPPFKEMEFSGRPFTGVSPEGTFEKAASTAHGRIFDGGYMDNYPGNILTALYDPSKDVVLKLYASYPGTKEIRSENIFRKMWRPIEMRAEEEFRRDNIRDTGGNVISWLITGLEDVWLLDFSNDKLRLMIRAGRDSAVEFMKKMGVNP